MPDASAPAPLPLFRRDLRGSRRGLLAWSIGLAVMAALYLPFYPSVGGSDAMQAYLGSFSPEVAALFGLDELGTGAGYVHATIYGLLGFLLLAIAGVSWGTASIAGAEESGDLELTLAHGVTRAQVVLERTLALLVKLLVLGAVTSLLVLAFDAPVGLGLEPTGLVAVTASLVLLCSVSGMVALAVGAVTGRRSAALAAGAAVSALAYALDAVAKTSGTEAVAAISPYHWAFGAQPLASGFDWAGLAALAGLSSLLLAAALFVFVRRDVGS